jgi:hypothetical protein
MMDLLTWVPVEIQKYQAIVGPEIISRIRIFFEHTYSRSPKGKETLTLNLRRVFTSNFAKKIFLESGNPQDVLCITQWHELDLEWQAAKAVGVLIPSKYSSVIHSDKPNFSELIEALLIYHGLNSEVTHLDKEDVLCIYDAQVHQVFERETKAILTEKERRATQAALAVGLIPTLFLLVVNESVRKAFFPPYIGASIDGWDVWRQISGGFIILIWVGISCGVSRGLVEYVYENTGRFLGNVITVAIVVLITAGYWWGCSG